MNTGKTIFSQVVDQFHLIPEAGSFYILDRGHLDFARLYALHQAYATRTSQNAVKSQVWIAISVYVPIAIIKKRLGLPPSLYTILQILSVTIFDKTPVLQALPKTTDFRKSNETLL